MSSEHLAPTSGTGYSSAMVVQDPSGGSEPPVLVKP